MFLVLRRCALLLALQFLIPGWATAQFAPADLPENEQHALYELGKVWGFLKYYHPTVQSGCIDWDMALLTSLGWPSQATSQALPEPPLAALLAALEASQSDCDSPIPEIQRPYDSGWIERIDLPESRREWLRHLAQPASSARQHYVGMKAAVGNPVFLNENRYPEFRGEDWRLRLLALFRYWNAIEYWFPYKDLIDEDWNTVLRSFIPRLYKASNWDAYLVELSALAASINDGHGNLNEANYIKPPRGRHMAPYSIRIIENKPVIWRRLRIKPNIRYDPANVYQLETGDVILSVDGKSIEELFASAQPYIGASNLLSQRRLFAQFLTNGDTPEVALEINRHGKTLTVRNGRLSRDQIDMTGDRFWHDHHGNAFRSLTDEIAYLSLADPSINDFDDFKSELLGHDALIVDLRSYPAKFMVFELGQHLVSEETDFARFTKAKQNHPGSFFWSAPVSLQAKEPYYQGRVIALIDDSTMSQAEYTAMALRAGDNTVLIGNQTAGADGNISYIPLPGGINAVFSGIGVFYPDNTPTQRVGIVPDIEIWPTIAGLRESRDEILEAAIREIAGDSLSAETIEQAARYNDIQDTN
tara:strand:- start:1010 stop:2770 length:1761 start_codon:yes stop_codon:yes gene_type:complete